MTEMTLEARVHVGDIIRSKEFAYGIYDYFEDGEGYYAVNRKIIRVDDINQKTRIICNKLGSPINPVSEDISAHDQSRGDAFFVVEKAEMRNPREDLAGYLPSMWFVEARRLKLNEDGNYLNKDGTYNTGDELIRFYQGEKEKDNGEKEGKKGKSLRNCIAEIEFVPKDAIILRQ